MFADPQVSKLMTKIQNKSKKVDPTDTTEKDTDMTDEDFKLPETNDYKDFKMSDHQKEEPKKEEPKKNNSKDVLKKKEEATNLFKAKNFEEAIKI